MDINNILFKVPETASLTGIYNSLTYTKEYIDDTQLHRIMHSSNKEFGGVLANLVNLPYGRFTHISLYNESKIRYTDKSVYTLIVIEHIDDCTVYRVLDTIGYSVAIDEEQFINLCVESLVLNVVKEQEITKEQQDIIISRRESNKLNFKMQGIDYIAIGVREVTTRSEFVQKIYEKDKAFKAKANLIGKNPIYSYSIVGEDVILNHMVINDKDLILPNFITVISNITEPYNTYSIDRLKLPDKLRVIGEGALFRLNIKEVVGDVSSIEYLGPSAFSRKTLTKEFYRRLGEIKGLNMMII